MRIVQFVIAVALALLAQGQEAPVVESTAPQVEQVAPETAVAEVAPAEAESVPAVQTEVRYALLVQGIDKDPEEQREKDQAMIRLSRVFSNADATVRALASPNSMANVGTEYSNRDSIQSALNQIASTSTPDDVVYFYYVGQANVIDGKLRLNLPGPDISHEELAAWLDPIKAKTLVVVLDCPSAGIAAKALARSGRIAVYGARSDQPHSTRFSYYFVPALGNAEADANGDNRVSLLESFQMAVRQTDDFYREQKLMKNETALLDDDGDGEPSQFPWEYHQSKGDGASADAIFVD